MDRLSRMCCIVEAENVRLAFMGSQGALLKVRACLLALQYAGGPFEGGPPVRLKANQQFPDSLSFQQTHRHTVQLIKT